MAAVLVAVAIGGITWMHKRPAPAIGGPFTLIDTKTGREVTDKDFSGKWLLVFFGYTHCPDICPTTLSDMSDALTKLGPLADHVQPLFITLDPKRDTQRVLGDYTSAFDPRIVALTGTPDQIAAVAREYRVYFKVTPLEGGDYSVDHSASIYVMRPDGRYTGSFPITSGSEALAKRLRSFL